MYWHIIGCLRFSAIPVQDVHIVSCFFSFNRRRTMGFCSMVFSPSFTNIASPFSRCLLLQFSTKNFAACRAELHFCRRCRFFCPCRLHNWISIMRFLQRKRQEKLAPALYCSREPELLFFTLFIIINFNVLTGPDNSKTRRRSC